MPTILEELVGVRANPTVYSKLDGSVKILVPLFLSLDVIFVRDLLSASLLVLVSLGFAILAGVPLRFLKSYMLLVSSLSVFIVLSFVLFTQVPGKPLFSATLLSLRAERGVWEWRLVVTDAALAKAAFFIARILAMILVATIFVATVSDRDVVWGLRRLGLPAGLAVSASLFFRGLSFFVSDFYTVREAMMARGVDFERTSLARRFLLYANALIPLLSLMVTRSLEISLALESRGIAPSTRFTTRYHRRGLTRLDLAILAVAVTATVLFAWWSLCS
ncbi:energy-coupling factor transporter transmembrane component T family protein [Infirmifilum sp. NZ]|uniref:energy-coupling factor transporter transmembrane component T family protein n=1 Tax=Infirmifilum sp. NZ TaxID=2926850 RepID=UPI0027A2E392|nr:energy-coupling factor transporter transmembrane component T [Infirmifilum sp. NZ]UNQ73223.1 energy-coupling factor transporter transmembrane protein EcfT [Infirmifilum sp. NZ]